MKKFNTFINVITILLVMAVVVQHCMWLGYWTFLGFMAGIAISPIVGLVVLVWCGTYRAPVKRTAPLPKCGR